MSTQTETPPSGNDADPDDNADAEPAIWTTPTIDEGVPINDFTPKEWATAVWLTEALAEARAERAQGSEFDAARERYERKKRKAKP